MYLVGGLAMLRLGYLSSASKAGSHIEISAPVRQVSQTGAELNMKKRRLEAWAAC